MFDNIRCLTLRYALYKYRYQISKFTKSNNNFLKQDLNPNETASLWGSFQATSTSVSPPSQTDLALLVGKLKQEVNHLVLQLMYERNLRYKYEEESNGLHFIKIERDQLIVEKTYLERNLKQMVEQYKNEVETCLSLQNKTELEAYQIELDEKNATIELVSKKKNA